MIGLPTVPCNPKLKVHKTLQMYHIQLQALVFVGAWSNKARELQV